MKRTIDIELHDKSKLQVSGTLFVIEGLDGIEFLVHRPMGRLKGWTASECVTGCKVISRAEKTQAEAIEAARQRCSGADAKKVVREAVAGVKNGR